MAVKSIAVVLALMCTASFAVEVEVLNNHYANVQKPKVGEWTPPEPPAKESPHLSGRVPAPKLDGADEERFEEAVARLGGSRKLLAAEGAFAGVSKVPHNWYVHFLCARVSLTLVKVWHWQIQGPQV